MWNLLNTKFNEFLDSYLSIAPKTEIDFSPSGIGLIIFDIFQPRVNEHNVFLFRTVESMLLLFPWISYVIVRIKFGVKGLVIFGIILLISYALFNYFLN